MTDPAAGLFKTPFIHRDGPEHVHAAGPPRRPERSQDADGRSDHQVHGQAPTGTLRLEMPWSARDRTAAPRPLINYLGVTTRS
jgi:hypothetical protein